MHQQQELGGGGCGQGACHLRGRFLHGAVGARVFHVLHMVHMTAARSTWISEQEELYSVHALTGGGMTHVPVQLKAEHVCIPGCSLRGRAAGISRASRRLRTRHLSVQEAQLRRALSPARGTPRGRGASGNVPECQGEERMTVPMKCISLEVVTCKVHI